jgi:Ca-activated chloride channel family protein
MPMNRLPTLCLLSLLLAPLGACTGKGPAPAARHDAPVQVAAAGTTGATSEARPLARSTGVVALEVVPQFERVDLRKLPQDLNLLVRLRGEGTAARERPPLDLVVVLDRSGSMGGDKILAVKQAALDLLKELKPNDRLTLISYSDDVTVHVERLAMDAAGAETVRAQVLPIQPTGGTALGPGLIRGLELLTQAKRSERELAHVMLFSDGQANIGEQSPDVLGVRAADGFKLGASVSTLGVGLDYNEDLMTRIADQGGGRYHFIKGADEVSRVLADEMAGLVSTTASGIQLELRPAPGVTVARVFGYPAREEQGTTRVAIGAIAANQVREMIVRVHLNSGSGEEVALGVLGMSFVDLTHDGKPGQVEMALALRSSSDEAEIRKSERTEVTVRVAEVESAEQLQLAAKAVESGNYDGAKQVIGASLQALQAQQSATPSPKLQQQIADLEAASAGVDRARNNLEEEKIFKKSSKAKAYRTMK